jgi:DNA-binding transcriptional MocR family regulator
MMILMIAVDASAETPIYRQLYDYFTAQIESGKLDSGERLPATRELAGQLGLNRTTVSAAYELLEAEGWITGEVGRGSFVRPRPVQNPRQPLNWQDILERKAPAARTPLASGPVISFANSRPSELLFPLDAFRASCDAVLASGELSSILQLGSPGGYEPLRQYLLEAARAEGTARPGDDLMIANGCQQALDLIRQVLIRPGDRIALEDPVYPGLKNLFQQSGAELAGVPVGAEGMEIEPLQKLRPKLLVVTPNFQNPTGSTMPLEARKALLGLPHAIVIENDIYGDLRYEGKPQPTLKQLDQTGDVILLRSFSKIAFPGLRVGWIVAPRPLIQRLMEAKQLSDLHTDQFSQAVLLDFARSGRLEEHQCNMQRAGASRLRAVLAACERWLPAGTRYSRPQGGMNLWIELPDELDANDLLARAQSQGVAYLPGRYFAVSRAHTNALRLSFAGLPEEQIERGVRILGTLFSRELEAERSRDREPAPAMV